MSDGFLLQAMYPTSPFHVKPTNSYIWKVKGLFPHDGKWTPEFTFNVVYCLWLPTASCCKQCTRPRLFTWNLLIVIYGKLRDSSRMMASERLNSHSMLCTACGSQALKLYQGTRDFIWYLYPHTSTLKRDKGTLKINIPPIYFQMPWRGFVFSAIDST